MENHPIDNLMKNTMENLKEMIDVNTIVGDAVESSDGSVILPISKVSFGFATGGSEFNSEGSSLSYPFGGGSGAGVTVKPVAFLVLKEDKVRLLQVDSDNIFDKIIDSIPQVIDIFKDNSKDEKKEEGE